VTSTRKTKSNRANARSSTGPKTPGGRARAARNALRFGLSLPVFSDPTLSQEVAALARQIAGEDADPEIQEHARRIAEAQADLRRIRTLRHDFIASALSDPNFDSCSNWNKKTVIALRIIRRCCRHEEIPDEEVRFLDSKPEGPDKFAAILADVAYRLRALDRYERRALSRRKFAIRAFDARRTRPVEAARPQDPEPDGGA
jgi:hypothetical protein